MAAMTTQPTPTDTRPILSHPFTDSGMGRAPFRFVGTAAIPSNALAEANPTAYNNALRDLPKLENGCGSCAHCCTGIMNIYIVQNADGQRYGVGCDCIEKVGDAKLTTAMKVAKKKAARAKTAAKNEARRVARAEADRTTLVMPSGTHKGKTAAETEAADSEYVQWVLKSDCWSQLTAWRAALELTPTAVAYRAEQAKAAAARNAAKAELVPLADRLADGGGGFRDSMAETLRNGVVLSGRALQITADILAKQCGRSNSKKYNAELDRVWPILSGGAE